MMDKASELHIEYYGEKVKVGWDDGDRNISGNTWKEW
jgi:hypothetical protein